MNNKISTESRGLLSNSLFIWALFVCLFIYASMRAWLVAPMLDELATFFDYIRTGHYFNSIKHLDANNHVLNSFFGHQFFLLFGDHFFLFRISSLLAFPFYFFSLKYIVQTILPRTFQVVVFLSLICIPWLFEYFSYSRGYGMAIAFFFTALAFTLRWKSFNHWKNFIGIFIFLLLSIASSLTYLLPSLILLAYILVVFFIIKDYRKSKILFNSLVILGWISAITPFILYSLRLKESGALWWGDQVGLWENTGKSLSRLVLFTDSFWVFFLITALILICFFLFVNTWKQKSFWPYLAQNDAMMFTLFIGTLVGIVSMRYLLDMNYPVDRVGMYLVPLFILFISVFLSKVKRLNYLLFGLLFMPISFIYHLNLHTSIYSPKDRIPTSLTSLIKKDINDENTLSAEYVSHLSYAYSCRNDEKVHVAYTVDKEEVVFGDYHIPWLGCDPVVGYSSLTENSRSTNCIIKRNTTAPKRVIIDTLLKDLNTDDRYFTIFKRPIDSQFQNTSIQVQINADIKLNEPTSNFNIYQTTLNESNDVVSTTSPILSWYFSDRRDVNFVFTNRIIKLQPEDRQFHFYLYNNDLREMNINFIRIQIYQVE